jgi:cytochrome c oxidase cbb3-type subunit 3
LGARRLKIVGMKFNQRTRTRRDYRRFAAVVALGCGLLCALGRDSAARNGRQQQTHLSPDQEAGRGVYEPNCASCHGLDGRGGERGPDISTRAQVVQLSDAETLEVFRTGKPASGMPPFEFLGNEKLKALLAYLRSLQGRDATMTLPGDALRGKTLFFGRARCSECHMVQGQGGFLGRDLTHYGATAAPRAIRDAIAGSEKIASRGNRITEVTVRDGGKLSGISRNEDNFSIQLQALDGTFHFASKREVTAIKTLPDPIMPANYGSTLTTMELDDLVNYLVTEAKKCAVGAQGQREDED